MTDPEPFLGEIRMFAFDFAPRGWAPCDGRLLPINQNQALFSLLGNMYGGNGTTTFALPNLQSRVPINQGHGAGCRPTRARQAAPTCDRGADAGAHPPGEGQRRCGHLEHAGAACRLGPTAHLRCDTGTAMNANMLGAAGGGQPHANIQPYLAVNFCIAMVGFFPARPDV